MFKAIYGTSIATMLLFVLFPYNVSAQIAPTNSAAISGSVSDSTGRPVANAKVSLSGARSTSTQTDAHGLFVFIGMPFGTYEITANAAALGTAERSISVEGDTNVTIAFTTSLINGLKVIATTQSSSNASFNVTPASITQVDPIASAFDGTTSWRKILEQIPGVAQGGLRVGNVASSSLPDSPIVPMQISINGTLSYETAVLLDDMPLIGGSPGVGFAGAGTGTNLGAYPLNGFGSADVVRGPGANAPSIVNSIGGSFVLHAPGIVNQNHYDLSVSTDPYGGIVANALIATHWGKLSTLVTYGVNDSPGPTNSAGILAFSLFPPSIVDGHAFSVYSPPCSLPSCSASFSGEELFNPNYAVGASPSYGFQKGLLICCVNQTTAWSQHSGSIALNYALSPSVNAQFFYAGNVSLMSAPGQDCTDNFIPPAGYTGGILAGAHLFSGSGWYGAAPYLQTSSLLEEKVVARIGTGVLRVSALQNRTWTSYSLASITSANFQLFGGGSLCSNTSPGCSTGTYEPVVFNGETHSVNYTAYDDYFLYPSNNRDLLLEYTTPLGENLHAGVSFVKSYYDIPNQDAYYLGAPYNCGGSSSTPSAISQTTNEFRIFVGGTPSDKTSLDLSLYFANADYHVQNPNDSTGNTYVDERYSYAAPRLGFVWRPTAAVAVRASVGGGFAEAPLGDLIGSNGTPNCLGGISCTETLTNVNLQPEKSFGFDLGTDVKLHYNTVLSFDVYRTNLYGQLYGSTSTSGSCPTCGGLPLFVTQYGNLGESRYEGVLLDLRHDAPHGIYWGLSGGLTRGYVVSVPAGFYNTASGTCNISTGTNCTNLTVVPGINFNGTSTETGSSIPYSQGLATFGYRWSPKKYIDLVGTYYGNNNTYFRPAFAEFDGHIGYPVSEKVSLLLTFRNITGIYDGATQIYSPSNFMGAPTITGLPYPLYGEEYGPRTVILTMRTSL